MSRFQIYPVSILSQALNGIVPGARSRLSVRWTVDLVPLPTSRLGSFVTCVTWISGLYEDQVIRPEVAYLEQGVAVLVPVSSSRLSGP